ncbi:N-6 DNA methylase [Sphingobacterium daejeonense]|uniref:N-6 DNA methylase n=1 Tax=Sphingobacterium daejeonense TaxID=371142 RepID=UPI001E336E5C|nr:N-6 DNA methylase [Sphingobacterium daejeonense]
MPIQLEPTKNKENFLMLNGGYGDFCLQTVNDDSDLEHYYSRSWSSNTKNFVVLENDKVKIFNWERSKITPEIVSQQHVAENFNVFYDYLLSKSFKSERDVVPFIIDIFRQFRNITLEKTNPVEALNLLFVLLTSLEDDYANFNEAKWNVKPAHIPAGFDFFTEKLRTGIVNIKPELDLIIRHSAGVLFQEAQKEVLFFNPQRDLFGGVSTKLGTKSNLYSSIHYTPPYLARTIVENAIRHLDLKKPIIKIFDPACGSSEFLIEALKQLKELKYSGTIKITGWDTSETATNTSKFLLGYEKRTIWKDKLEFDIRLVLDSLVEEWTETYDLILMNPPFVSWELLGNKDARDAVKETLGANFSGKPNQASAFFYKAIQFLSEYGVIGCVVPSSLLTLDSYKNLRNSAIELITLKLVGKLGNFVFEDALTDVSIIVGHRPKVDIIPTILWTRNEKSIAQNALRDLRKMYYSNQLTVNQKDYSIFQPITFPIIQDSWKSISLAENELLKTLRRFTLEKKLVKVKDVFDVQQGVNSGSNPVFKITKAEYEDLPEKERKYFRPVVDNKAIKNGILIKTNYIWYPYNRNGITLRTEAEFEEGAPVFYEKLLQSKDALASRPRKSILNWWYLSEHRAWLLRKEPRLVSTRFGNSDSFAFDANGDFIVENGNAWLPKKIFEESDFYFYVAFFSSPFFDKLLSIYSKQLSGGNWYDLGRKYSQEIPIPDVNSTEVKSSDAYLKLVEMGKELSTGNIYVKNFLDEILLKYFYPIA